MFRETACATAYFSFLSLKVDELRVLDLAGVVAVKFYSISLKMKKLTLY
jgi:hypothetical protein